MYSRFLSYTVMRPSLPFSVTMTSPATAMSVYPGSFTGLVSFTLTSSQFLLDIPNIIPLSSQKKTLSSR